MISLICLLLLFLSISNAQNATNSGTNDANCGRSSVFNDGHRIVNGENALPNEFPWFAHLYVGGASFCGAAVINRRWLVTAAHCFDGMTSSQRLYVEVGSIRRRGGRRFAVNWRGVFRHFNYDQMQELYDIALIKTTEPMPVNTNAVNTICLPNHMQPPRSNALVVSGFGLLDDESYDFPETLQKVTLDVISNRRCDQMMGFSDPSEICTYSGDRDACGGDSGGPLIEYISGRAYLVGVVAYGRGCADGYPGVFTRVSHYRQWIDWVLSYDSN